MAGSFLPGAVSATRQAVANRVDDEATRLLLANRAQTAVSEFQQAPAAEEALFIMVQSYEKLQLTELRDAAERVLQQNFPNSPFLRRGFAARERPWWKLW